MRKWPEPQVGSIRRRLGQAELVDRRLERAVEDEVLDEVGRLQQRVALLRRLGQVLVEVAEEAGAQLGSREVVRELAAARDRVAPRTSRSAAAPSTLGTSQSKRVWCASKSGATAG